MRTITTIAEMPNVPAVDAMYGAGALAVAGVMYYGSPAHMLPLVVRVLLVDRMVWPMNVQRLTASMPMAMEVLFVRTVDMLMAMISIAMIDIFGRCLVGRSRWHRFTWAT